MFSFLVVHVKLEKCVARRLCLMNMKDCRVNGPKNGDARVVKVVLSCCALALTSPNQINVL